MMWCIVRRIAWSSSARIKTWARASGPRARSKGRRASDDGEAAGLRLAVRRVERPEIDRWSVGGRSGSPRPGMAGRRPRRTLSVASRAGGPSRRSSATGSSRSSGPRTRPASVMLKVGCPGDNWSRNQRACWENEAGTGPSCSSGAERRDCEAGDGPQALLDPPRDGGDGRVAEELAQRQLDGRARRGSATRPGWRAASGRPGRRSCRRRRRDRCPARRTRCSRASPRSARAAGRTCASSVRPIPVGGRQGGAIDLAVGGQRQGVRAPRTPAGSCSRGATS